MVWGYYELSVPPDMGPGIDIVTCLRAQGCICTPVRLSVFSFPDPDSLFTEYSCLTCDRSVTVSTHRCSIPTSSQEEQ